MSDNQNWELDTTGYNGSVATARIRDGKPWLEELTALFTPEERIEGDVRENATAERTIDLTGVGRVFVDVTLDPGASDHLGDMKATLKPINGDGPTISAKAFGGRTRTGGEATINLDASRATGRYRLIVSPTIGRPGSNVRGTIVDVRTEPTAFDPDPSRDLRELFDWAMQNVSAGVPSLRPDRQTLKIEGEHSDVDDEYGVKAIVNGATRETRTVGLSEGDKATTAEFNLDVAPGDSVAFRGEGDIEGAFDLAATVPDSGESIGAAEGPTLEQQEQSDRRTRRELRQQLDETLEAEGYDPDDWTTDARADGTLILQDPETNKTKTIEPDTGESGIDSAVESLGSSSDSSTSDSDSTGGEQDSSPGGGADGLGQVGGIMLVAAIATAVYYGVTQR